MTDIKCNLLDHIKRNLNQKIDSLKQSIESAKESRDNETKSSVGDKYETSRTLMQFEVEKNQLQLNKTENLLFEIQKIDCEKKSDKIGFGSLVITSQTNYFISAAIGKINIENYDFYCISLASPIGKLLVNKKTGDSFTFQRNEITILETH